MRDIKESLRRIEMQLGNRGPDYSSGLSQEPDAYQSAPKKPAATPRCNAITKKGTQCSRSARSGGYCWQHGG